MSGNCNHVDETLEMRYTSLRTAYPFPPRELPHTLGVRVQRGHSEPLLPSHPSPVCLFGPWPPSLSQDLRTGSGLASGRWHLVPPYACEPSRPIRVWDAMRAVGVVGLPMVDRGGREVGGYSGLSSSAVSRFGVRRCVRMYVRRCT